MLSSLGPSSCTKLLRGLPIVVLFGGIQFMPLLEVYPMLELTTKQLLVSTTLGWEDGSVSDVVALHGQEPDSHTETTLKSQEC